MPELRAIRFKAYMISQSYSNESCKSYMCIVRKFLTQVPNADEAKHMDILHYFAMLNKLPIQNSTKHRKLTAIKKYYDYLIDIGKREDHPCHTLFLKGNLKRGIIHADLLTCKELETLLKRKNYYSAHELRNQIIMSFFIYQGLLPNEVLNIKISDLNFIRNTIRLKGGRMLTARKLQLHEKQISLIKEYIKYTRKRLVKEKDNDYLILTFHGRPISVAALMYLIEGFKNRFPGRQITSTIIRDSVISHWLNEKKIPLEQVQLLAGHRWISSTERYQNYLHDDGRAAINKWYPI
jgi:integrase/recombinase XerD